MGELEEITVIDQLADFNESVSSLETLLTEIRTQLDNEAVVLETISVNTSTAVVCDLWVSSLLGFIIGVGLVLIFKRR